MEYKIYCGNFNDLVPQIQLQINLICQEAFPSTVFLWDDDLQVFWLEHIPNHVTALLGFEKDTHLIWNVVTHKDFRRQGWAKCLIEYFQNWFIRQGNKSIKLFVTRNNEGAKELYLRLGFVIGGEHPFDDALQMIWESDYNGKSFPGT